MSFKSWDITGFDRGAAVELCRRGISPLVSVFLSARGFTRFDDAAALLDPCEMFDPWLLADMDKAVARIKSAVEKGERIAVYGDYDVDGMTACALLAMYLRSAGADFEIYIPGRIDEGYGLSRAALDTLKSRGVQLIITVDCGITAIDEAIYARELGMGLIITDHHECMDRLPEADAVIDPRRPDCGYPNDTLAGVGVAFKLVCALEGGGKEKTDELLRRYSGLVALGTIADVMSVTGENRELIRRGLCILNDNPSPGLKALLRQSGAERGRTGTSTVGFVLAPRLNAAGRMGQTDTAVKLLLTENDAEARHLALELDRLNTQRKKLESEIYENAESLLEEISPGGPIILARRDWHQGVTGIVAAKISERYCLPAIIISIDEDNLGRGSCRSFGTFGLHSALRICDDLLISYGGHEMAAGVTIVEENIDEFRRRINEYYRDHIKSVPKPGLKLDFEVEKPELLSPQNVEALELLEPFGSGNPPPALCILGAQLVEFTAVGAGRHTRLRIKKSDKILDCIYFGVPPEEMGVAGGMMVDIAFEPQINEFRGRTNVQLQVLDIRKSE